MMYFKFLGAIACLILSCSNVIAAVQKTPIRTVIGESTRPQTQLIDNPGANVHLLSAGVFLAGLAVFVALGIKDYNNNLQNSEDSSDYSEAEEEVDAPVSPESVLAPEEDIVPKPVVQKRVPNTNIVPFRARVTADGQLSSEDFAQKMLEEDYWEEDPSTDK